MIEEKTINDENVSLHPPFALQYNKLKAFFNGDYEITVGELNPKTRSCVIYSKNYMKYWILDNYLIKDYIHDIDGLLVEVEFNGEYTRLGEDTLAALLTTNPHFDSYLHTDDPINPKRAVMFKNETIQYPADNFFSPYGHNTTLAEDLVKEIFVNKPNCHTMVDISLPED